MVRTDIWKGMFNMYGVHQGQVTRIAFSPDSRLLAAGDAFKKSEAVLSGGGAISVWNMENGGLLGVLRPSSAFQVRSLAFCPDGQRIASASEDGILRIWNVNLIGSTNQEEDGHVDVDVEKFALSGDGKRVLVLTGDHRLYLRNARKGDLTSELVVSLNIWSIALNHSGHIAACGTKAGAIIVWDTVLSHKEGKNLEIPLRHSRRPFVKQGRDKNCLSWK